MGKIVLLHLRPGDKRTLENLLRTEKDARLRQRYQYVLLCFKRPTREVAKDVNLSERQLRRIISFYRKSGIDGLKYGKPTGRPSRLSDKKQERIISIIESNPQGWETKQIRDLIYKEGGILYAKRHIYRIAQKWGFAEVIPRTKSRRRNDKEVINFKKT